MKMPMKAIKLIDVKETQRLATVNGGNYVVEQMLVDKVNEIIKQLNSDIADKRKASKRCL